MGLKNVGTEQCEAGRRNGFFPTSKPASPRWWCSVIYSCLYPKCQTLVPHLIKRCIPKIKRLELCSFKMIGSPRDNPSSLLDSPTQTKSLFFQIPISIPFFLIWFRLSKRFFKLKLLVFHCPYSFFKWVLQQSSLSLSQCDPAPWNSKPCRKNEYVVGNRLEFTNLMTPGRVGEKPKTHPHSDPCPPLTLVGALINYLKKILIKYIFKMNCRGHGPWWP